MPQKDDDIYELFLEESREHLKNLEADILEIEDQGEQIDEELVNKIFRAVHTLKGGSGFFNLTNVKTLAHNMENLLGLIRNREIQPTSDVVSVLLESADVLQNMVYNPESQGEVNIEPQVTALKNVLTRSSSPETKEIINDSLDVGLEDGRTIFNLTKLDIYNAQRGEKGGNYIYLLKYYLLNDIERKGKTPWDVISELLELTLFIDSKIDIESVGTLKNEPINTDIPFYVLCATVLEPDFMSSLVGLDSSQIRIVSEKRVNEDDINNQLTKKGKKKRKKTQTNPGGNDKKQVAERENMKAENETLRAVEKNTENPDTLQSDDPDKNGEKRQQESKSARKDKNGKRSESEVSIRVNLEHLDKLMTLAGELVLTRNELVQNTDKNSMEGILTATQKVDSITSELQEAIMYTRMQSIGIVFNKFKRIVRDLSKDLGKTINLEIEGEEVELDKTIIETIGDPLTHLIRNSVDHGIESPGERLKNNKPERGTIKLKAYHEAGQVVIEIIDDGAGIDPEKIKAKAMAKGLYTETQLDSMIDKEIIRMIFKPGFSTAEKVTDVSGRGVGMDVVMSNLIKVGGVVDVDSVPGNGCTIRVKLPLTLAIIPSLLVSVEDERFAIPQVNLVELVRISAKDVKKKIEKIGNAEVMRLRGDLLPLVSLSRVLKIEEKHFIHPVTGKKEIDRRKNIADRRKYDEENVPAEIKERRSDKDRRTSPFSALNIAVVSAGDFRYGIIVDNLLDSEEIVVKPLGSHISNCREYAGATILGDGHVALILDVEGIREKSKLNVNEAVQEIKKKEKVKAAGEFSSIQSLLLVENGSEELFAIPLDLVSRIEKIPGSTIERTGGKKCVTYRNTSLLLFSIEDVANVSPCKEKEAFYVIIFQTGKKEAGILVSELIDITDISVDVDDITHKQAGILGSAIINNKNTLMLDMHSIVSTLAPELLQRNKSIKSDKNKRYTLLIVEDSMFFLKQMSSFMEEEGFNILSAEDGRKAIAVLENSHQEIDLILTDIEMPNMDGLEMTSIIRQDDRFKHLPIIAVTSVAGKQAEQAGKIAGINEYLIKLDKEQILSKCCDYLSIE